MKTPVRLDSFKIYKYSTKTKLTKGSGTDAGVMISFKEETHDHQSQLSRDQLSSRSEVSE